MRACSCRETSIVSFSSSVPADEHMEILSVAENGREGLGEVLDAFLPAQSADVADEGRAGGKRGW